MDDDSPTVIGKCNSPMPPQADAEAAWRRLFIARMVERGVDPEDAKACCDSNDFTSPFGWDLQEDPRIAADDELECWTDDGDGPVD